MSFLCPKLFNGSHLMQSKSQMPSISLRHFSKVNSSYLPCHSFSSRRACIFAVPVLQTYKVSLCLTAFAWVVPLLASILPPIFTYQTPLPSSNICLNVTFTIWYALTTQVKIVSSLHPLHTPPQPIPLTWCFLSLIAHTTFYYAMYFIFLSYVDVDYSLFIFLLYKVGIIIAFFQW